MNEILPKFCSLHFTFCNRGIYLTQLIRISQISNVFRHAGPDPASRKFPDKSREYLNILDPGFHRELWIPAFAGMTIMKGQFG